jgi:hypothetical protein
MDRRRFLAAGVVAAALSPRRIFALGTLDALAPKTPITVYRSPLCDCCHSWIEYLKTEGFAPKVLEQDDNAMTETKIQLNVPQALWSCHTALLGSYAIEGHVPAEDLRRLLAEKPKVLGISAAGMPQSAPGMYRAGEKKQPYTVTSWAKGGSTQVFAKH